jgi:CelD/BcsL family acetyltransferase involved in cellulose biosynthesis
MASLLPSSAIAPAWPRVQDHSLSVSEITEPLRFEAIRGEWNHLVEASRPEPFYRREYIGAFLHNFLPGSALRVLTGRDSAGALKLGLPLVMGSGSICGLRTRELSSPTNVHSLRFDLIAQNPPDENAVDARAQGLLLHLDADQSWDVLKLTDIPAQGQAWRIYRAAEAAGFPVGAWEAQRSPYLTLVSQGEPVLGLRAKFRANLRRRRKRLAEQGEITVERLEGDSLNASDLLACLVMESAGWKGREGTAAGQSEEARGFHLELLKTEGYKELLSLYLLKLSGRPIAFQYGLTSHGVFSLVMTSYEESFAEFSPGHLLTEEVLNDCVSRGLREFDFLGCDLPWKMEWTATVRPHHWLYIFRKTTRGRFLRRVKFGWAVTARQLLTQWGMRLSFGRASPRRFA